MLLTSSGEAKDFVQQLARLKFELSEKVSTYVLEEQMEHLQAAMSRGISGGGAQPSMIIKRTLNTNGGNMSAADRAKLRELTESSERAETSIR